MEPMLPKKKFAPRAKPSKSISKTIIFENFRVVKFSRKGHKTSKIWYWFSLYLVQIKDLQDSARKFVRAKISNKVLTWNWHFPLQKVFGLSSLSHFPPTLTLTSYHVPALAPIIRLKMNKKSTSWQMISKMAKY